MDPMLATGQEKISAMGYGAAINALSNHEGGIARYFSQRFAQVTNPPLDSIREADGMTLRVALGAKPNSGATPAPQIMIDVADPHPSRHAEDPRSEADAGAAVRQPVPHRAQRRRGQRRRVDQGHRRPVRRGRGLRPRIRRHRGRLRPPRLERARRDAHDHRHLGHQPAAHRTGPAPPGVGDRGERPGLLVAPRRDGARVRRVGGLLARRADARRGEVRPRRTVDHGRVQAVREGRREVVDEDDGPRRAVHGGELHRRRVLRALLPRHQRAGAGQVLPQRDLRRGRRRVPHAVATRPPNGTAAHWKSAARRTCRCSACSRSGPRAPGTPTGRRRCAASST